MAEKFASNDTFIDVPVPAYEEAAPKQDDQPPEYENPQLNFDSRWKDVGFAVAFVIHIIIVIILGLVLGLPVLSKSPAVQSVESKNTSSESIYLTPVLCSLGGAIIISGAVSLVVLFTLQLCAGFFVKSIFALFILMLVLLGVGAFFILPPLCIAPGLILVFILIYLSCVRRRISFAEAHLQAGGAALRNSPSVILIALVILILEFLWWIMWVLMAVGVMNTLNVRFGSNTNVTVTNTTNMGSDYLTTTYSPDFFTYSRQRPTTSRSYWIQKATASSSIDYRRSYYSSSQETQYDSSVKNENALRAYGIKVVIFFLVLSLYWGTVTFGNMIHFITACTVGKWWFVSEGSQHYAVGNSIKRAFTSSLGTIALGSLFEAIIKALRFFTSKDRKKNIFSCVVDCILQIIEKVVGYINEWAFVFAALTGQSFVEAGKSFFELFKKRGWSAVLNDSIVGSVLGLINFGTGLITAAAGGFTMYLMMPNVAERIAYIIIVSIICLIIGLLVSSMITSLLMSCVRTVFVCFALNPAALGATHPDHLQRLNKVWHKFYPEEFAASGYANQYKEMVV